MDRQTFITRKPQTRDVTVDGVGTVQIRKLSQSEVERCRSSYSTQDKAAAGLRFVVNRCLLNDEGERIYGDGEIDKVGELDFDIVKTLAEEIADFSGLKPPKTEGSNAFDKKPDDSKP